MGSNWGASRSICGPERGRALAAHAVSVVKVMVPLARFTVLYGDLMGTDFSDAA